MRDIKFRQPLRDKKCNFIEWFYWGFIEGDFITPANQMNGIDTRKESNQFTGLLDKNGKEIYEGDILGTNDDKCFVTWRIDLASFALRKDGWMYDHYFGEGVDVGNVEVIGNIYSNPELL